MATLYDLLKPVDVTLDQLLLDPNNPRFADLGESFDRIHETRIGEERAQEHTLEKMKSPRLDVAELRDTIKTIGFLPMDRIVVRRWSGSSNTSPKYVVVEGNRRVAALKWLIDLHETGRELFTPEQLANFKNLQALVLDDTRAPSSALLVLPGLRHISGIKEWGPYQKGRAVFELREGGSSPQEVAQSLGLSTRGANQLWRSYLALRQMHDDEEYEELAEPKMYSYFEEVFKRPNVREWLGWSDSEGKFTRSDRVHEFYGWIVGEEKEDGSRGDAKLPEAKSVREISQFIDDEAALAIFRGRDGSLTTALAGYQAKHQEAWQASVSKAEATLASLAPDTLRGMAEEELTLLTRLRERIDLVLEDRAKLIQTRNG